MGGAGSAGGGAWISGRSPVRHGAGDDDLDVLGKRGERLALLAEELEAVVDALDSPADAVTKRPLGDVPADGAQGARGSSADRAPATPRSPPAAWRRTPPCAGANY
jgi:hypothetical protein